jgi:hypothetical protein
MQRHAQGDTFEFVGRTWKVLDVEQYSYRVSSGDAFGYVSFAALECEEIHAGCETDYAARVAGIGEKRARICAPVGDRPAIFGHLQVGTNRG